MEITRNHSSLKTLTITNPAPDETTEGSPIALPTSEPGSGQVQFTVAAGHLPTFSFAPFSYLWCSSVGGSGKVATAATISWKMYKTPFGGARAQIATGSTAVTANYYWTLIGGFYDMAVGDVLEMVIWSNQTDSDYRWKGLRVQPTRVWPVQDGSVLLNVSATQVQNTWSGGGSPWVSGSTGAYWLIYDNYTTMINLNTSPIVWTAKSLVSTLGLWAAGNGDKGTPGADAGNFTSSNAKSPFYRTDYRITVLSYRVLKL